MKGPATGVKPEARFFSPRFKLPQSWIRPAAGGKRARSHAARPPAPLEPFCCEWGGLGWAELGWAGLGWAGTSSPGCWPKKICKINIWFVGSKIGQRLRRDGSQHLSNKHRRLLQRHNRLLFTSCSPENIYNIIIEYYNIYYNIYQSANHPKVRFCE